jgi:hypothetical protein
MRPKPIKWFERYFLASIGTSILAVLLDYGFLRQRALDQGASPLGPMIGIIAAAVGGWLFWYFIARRASNIAKWINVVMTALGTLTLPWSWSEVFGIGPVYSLLAAISYICSIVASIYLFHPDAVVWLKSKGRNAPVDPGVFS